MATLRLRSALPAERPANSFAAEARPAATLSRSGEGGLHRGRNPPYPLPPGQPRDNG